MNMDARFIFIIHELILHIILLRPLMLIFAACEMVKQEILIGNKADNTHKQYINACDLFPV